MNHKKYLLQQEKIKARKEQEVKLKTIQAAVELFNKTKVWRAPQDIDFDLDVLDIKRRAEGQVGGAWRGWSNLISSHLV